MIPKCMVKLAVLCATINCYKLNDTSILDSACKIHLVKQYFPNAQLICFIFQCQDDVNYIKYIEKPVILLKEGLFNVPGEIAVNFVIHTEEILFERTIGKLIDRDFFYEKVLIILKHAPHDINKMFRFLWFMKVVDVVILVDGDFPMLYGYQPLTSSSNCGELPLIQLKKECDIEALIGKNAERITNFYNCTIYQRTPYSIKYRGNKDHVIINKQILSFLTETLNFSIAPYNDDTINSSMLFFHQLESIPLYVQSLEFVDNFENDEYAWVVPKGKRLTTFQVISRTYDRSTWIFIIVAFFTVFLIWCFLISFTKNIDVHRSRDECFFAVIQLTLGIGLTRFPRTNTYRLILLFYILYSLNMCALFGANLVNILTIPKFEKGISTLEELANSNLSIKLLQSHISKMMFSTNRTVIQKRLRAKLKHDLINSIDDILQNIDLYRNYSLLIRQTFLPKKYDVHTIIDKTHTNPINMSMMSRKGLFFIKMFRKIIERMRESGILNKILLTDLSKSFIDMKNDSKIKLSLDHLQFTFLLWVGGLILASLCFLVEHLMWWYSRRNDMVIPF